MLVLFGVMLTLLLMGFPMMMTMLLSTLVYVTMYAPMVQPFITVQQMILGVQSPVLMAIPMFILAADIMCKGQTSERLLDFVESLVGHMRGASRPQLPLLALFSERFQVRLKRPLWRLELPSGRNFWTRL